MFGYSLLNSIFIYGLAAISVPVIIHLLFKARRERVMFSSILFILASVVRKSSRIKFKEILLLLLRVAMFALIVLAFARPYLERKPGSAFALQGRVDLAVIMDDSYSTQYLETTGTMRFERARAAALEQVGGLRSGDRVAVIRTSHGGDVLVKLTPNFATATGVIKVLKPSGEFCRFSDAFKRAGALLAESSADHKYVLFVSDMQQVSFEGETLAAAIKGLGQGTQVRLADISAGKDARAPAESINLAIRDVRAPDWGWVSGQPLSLVVAVANYSKSRVADATVSLQLTSGEKFPGKTFDLGPGETKEVPVTATFPEGPEVAGWVELNGRDPLPLDDRFYFHFQATKAIRVLCVENALADIPYFQKTYYLRKALNPKLASEGAPNLILPDLVDVTRLTAEALSDHDVLVLADVTGVTADQAAKIGDFVRKGGGLLVFLGPDVDPAVYNERLFGPEGSGVLPCRLKTAQKPVGGEYWNIAKFEKGHYVFRPFTAPEGGDVGLPRFTQLYGVDLKEGLALGAKVLASYDNDAPAVIERPIEKGRTILFTTTCDVEWTDMPKRMMYLPLMHQIMRYLTGHETFGQTRHVVGQPLRMPSGGAGVREGQKVQLTVTGQAATEVKLDPGADILCRDPQAPGIYKFSAEGGPAWQFAVNLDTSESDLLHATPQMIERLGTGGDAGAKAAAKAAQQVGLNRGSEDPGGLWRTLFALALALMVFELILANSIPR